MKDGKGFDSLSSDGKKALVTLADRKSGDLFIMVGAASKSNEYGVAKKTARELASRGYIQIIPGRTLSGHDIARITRAGRSAAGHKKP